MKLNKPAICYVSYDYFPTQGSRALYEYIKKLPDYGYELYLICASRAGEKKYEKKDHVTIFRIPVNTNKKMSLSNFNYTLRASKILNKLIKNKAINLVHVFSYAFSFIIKLNTLNCSKKVKWIYDVRSGPIRKGITYRIGKILLFIESFFFDVIFVISKEVQKEIFGECDKRHIIIPVGVDLNFFYPRKGEKVKKRCSFKEDDIVITYLGSINPSRNIKELINSFYLLSNIKKLKMMIIGGGENLSRLKKYVKKLSLNDKILFTGYVESEIVPLFLSFTDIAISYIPITLAYNNQPSTKTLEYLACGLPVIATNTKGNKKLIVDGVNGLLVNDDRLSIANAIKELLNDNVLRKRLASNSRRSVLNYDWGDILEKKLLPIYMYLIKTK